MGCAESTEHDDEVDHSLDASVNQDTVDIDTSRVMRGTPRAAAKPIGFSRVAEARLKRQQQEEAEKCLDRETIPPLPTGESTAAFGPTAIAPPNPLTARSRTLVFDADSSVSPIQSGTSVFSDGPPAADQRTLVPANDDVLSQTSLASSAPVLSADNSNSGSPEFTSNMGGNKCCVAEDVPSPLPRMFP